MHNLYRVQTNVIAVSTLRMVHIVLPCVQRANTLMPKTSAKAVMRTVSTGEKDKLFNSKYSIAYAFEI